MMLQLNHIRVSDLSIAYRRTGTGPPLVFLHGFLCDSRCWLPQLDALSRDFDVIAWDAPGAGASSDPTEPFSTLDYATVLDECLTGIGVPKVTIVGLSWGGILAQVFYAHFPHRVRQLVLAGAYAGWKGSLDSAALAARVKSCLELVTATPEEVVAQFMPGFFTEAVHPDVHMHMARIVSEFHPVGFRLMTLSSAETDTRTILGGISVPTLLIWGEADARSPILIAEQFRTRIPRSELRLLPGVGHVSNMEAPEAFNRALLEFLQH